MIRTIRRAFRAAGLLVLFAVLVTLGAINELWNDLEGEE